MKRVLLSLFCQQEYTALRVYLNVKFRWLQIVRHPPPPSHSGDSLNPFNNFYKLICIKVYSPGFPQIIFSWFIPSLLGLTYILRNCTLL